MGVAIRAEREHDALVALLEARGLTISPQQRGLLAQLLQANALTDVPRRAARCASVLELLAPAD